MEFQRYSSIPMNDLKDLITVIYVLTDDLYQECVPESIKHRLHKEKAKLSDSEIITIALAGEVMSIDSENAWVPFVQKNMKDLFPCMCERSRFNRLRRNLWAVIRQIRIKLGEELGFTKDDMRIADSFPLEVCEFGRAHFCHTFRGEGADYGYCASKKKTFFGFRVHVLCTINGYITDFLLAPASADDRTAVFELVEEYDRNLRLIGDKGYVGFQFAQELWAEKGMIMIALKRNNAKDPDPKPFRQMVFKVRRRIETCFSQLAGQFNAESVLAKTLWGLLTRLQSKFFAFDMCFAINCLLGRFDSFAQIKNLAF